MGREGLESCRYENCDVQDTAGIRETLRRGERPDRRMSLESKGMGEELNIGRRMSETEYDIDETKSPELGHRKSLFRAH